MTPTPDLRSRPGAGRGSGRPDDDRDPAGVTIARIRGVPVILTPSWFLLVAFVTVAYGPRLEAQVGSDALASGYVAALTFSLLLAAGVVLHEVGHLLVARGLGIPVRRLSVFLLGGATEMARQPRTPAGEYLVAVSGPVVSLVLGTLALGLVPLAPDGSATALLLRDLGAVNLLLALFNLLPAVPLDGGRVLRAVVWRLTGSPLSGTRAAAWGGRVLAVLVSFAALAFAALLTPADAASTLDALMTAVFGGLLSAFLWAGSSAALRAATLEARMPEVRVRTLVRPWIGVRPDLPVAEAVRRAQAAGARALVVLDGRGQPHALVSEAAVRALPPERRPWVEVGTVARAIDPARELPVGLEGADVVDVLRSSPAGEYLVRDGDRVAGVLAAEDVGAVLDGKHVPPSSLVPS